MERPINYQEIKGKFQTVEEFNGAFDYILKIYEETMYIMELDMTQAVKNKTIKSLNREINRINILFKDFISENRAQLIEWPSVPADQFYKSTTDWS